MTRGRTKLGGVRRAAGSLLLAACGGLGNGPTAHATDEQLEELARAAAEAVVAEASAAASSSSANAEQSAAAESSPAAGDADRPKSSAGEAPEPARAAGKSAGEPAPRVHAVALHDLRIEATLEGAFAARPGAEAALRPKAWTNFEIVELVPHGARVSKGQTLIRFDDEKFADALEDKAVEQQLGELALLQAEEEFPRLEKSAALSYEQAQRAYDDVQEERRRFLEVMRPMSIRMAENGLKSARQTLENAQEELAQLEKMYEADELTEETEEIVLKRQRFQAEMARFNLEYAEVNYDYALNVSIPRRERGLDTEVEQGRLAWERAKMAKSLGLSRQRFELEQLRRARAKAVEEHAKLLADRELFALKAPSDGIAYYGRCVDGKWVDLQTLESKLVPFGKVPPDTVLMTVVAPRPPYVEAVAGETQFVGIKAGLAARVVPVADEAVSLRAKVREVAAVPGAGNKFRVQLELESADAPEWLVPGLACKATVATYEKKQAVALPAALVRTDDQDGGQRYVLLQVAGDEPPVRRPVRLGKTQGKLVEVTEGLAAGDQVLHPASDDQP